MCNMQELYLQNNQISDTGMISFTDALGKGALPQLEKLSLGSNKIGDSGLSAFAKVLTPGPSGKGALASLEMISVDNTSHPQLVAACQPRGIIIF